MGIRQLIDTVTISFGPVSLSTDLGKRKIEVLRRLKILESDLEKITSALAQHNVEQNRLLSIMRSRPLSAQEIKRSAELDREGELLVSRGDKIYDEIDKVLVDVRVLGGNAGNWSRKC